MKAMILAAGRGERMRPLTDTTPKPLLKIGDKTLIEHHLVNLSENGFKQVVINLSYLGNQIQEALGDGERYGVSIIYSDEGADALETGGGIYQSLPLLGNEPFVVVNADIWCAYPIKPVIIHAGDLAHLILVDNPPQHLGGDFFLSGDKLSMHEGRRLTFSGIGYYRPELFEGSRPGKFPLAPLLHKAISDKQVSGTHYTGQWSDIGTPDRLQHLLDSLEKAGLVSAQ